MKLVVMKVAVRLLPAALACAIAAPSSAADAARIVSAKRALERGVYAKTPEALIKARAEFEAMSASEPKSATLHYWIAVADWRLVPRLAEKKAQAQRYLKDGLAQADQALKLDSKLAEALAIRASLQGLSIQFDPSVTMSLGAEMEMTMHRALEMAPDNPRIHLLDAIGTLHKPEFVGGGADKALAKFKRALELFEAKSPSDSTAPAWGHEDALIWAGRSAVGLKDFEAARGFYDRALTLNPRNGWVRYTLLPELEKAVAAADSAKGGS
jgi:tetratricopeptide (TPR) repeat protein